MWLNKWNDEELRFAIQYNGNSVKDEFKKIKRRDYRSSKPLIRSIINDNMNDTPTTSFNFSCKIIGTLFLTIIIFVINISISFAIHIMQDQYIGEDEKNGVETIFHTWQTIGNVLEFIKVSSFNYF